MKSSKNIRENILDTAANLFYKQGYNSTGINQIIDEAEIARASLYHHFKSKSDLFYAYLEQTNENWFAELHNHIDKIASPKNKLLGIFDFRVKRQIYNKFNGCPFFKATAEVPQDDLKAFEIIDQNKMKFLGLILELLQEIDTSDSILTKEELADTIYLIIEGATVTVNFQKNKTMLTKAKDLVVKLL